MHNKIIIYDQSRSMVEVAAIMRKCPGFYGSPGSMPTSCYNFGLGTTDVKNEMWANYRSLYLGYKNEIIAEDADAYINGECLRGINACIGHDNFIYTSTVMSKSQFNIDSKKPCTVNSFTNYVNKTRRFDFNSTVAKLKVDSDKANFNRAYFGAKCNLTDDIINWLNELIYKGVFISSAHHLYEDKYFTPEFHEALLSPSPPGSTYWDFQWNTSISGPTNNILTGYFTCSTGCITPTCSLTLTLPEEYDLTGGTKDVITHLKYLRNYSAGVLILEATFATGLKEEITLATCFPVSDLDCTFKDDCKVSDYGNSIANLLSALAAGPTPKLTSTTAVDLEVGDYKNFVTRFIRSNIGSSSSNNLRWTYLGSGVFKINQNGTTPSGDDINISFTSYIPSTGTFTHTNLGEILYFTDFTFDGSGLYSKFKIKGWTATRNVIISGTVSRGVIGKCYDPLPATCETPPQQATRDFEAFLKGIIMDHPTSNSNLLLNNDYTRVLEAYVGKGVSTTLTTPVYGENSITTSIEVSDGTNLINKCIIQLYRNNMSYDTVNGSLGAIVDLGLLHTDGGNAALGRENHFTVVVQFPGGELEEVWGYVSCIPLDDCITCQVPKGDPPGDCATYKWYKQEMENFNASPDFPDVNIVFNDNTFPCLCVKNYLYYIRAWKLGINSGMFKSPCDTPFTPSPYPPSTLATPPIDILEFATDYNCGFNFSNIETCCRLWQWSLGTKIWQVNKYSSMLLTAVNNYNTIISALAPPWYEPIVVSPDTIGSTDCECALRYAVYLNRWVNDEDTEEPDDIPDFAPLPYSLFKKNGCDADCWWEYHYYLQKTQAAGGNPAAYSKKFDCDCWRKFADNVNLATSFPAQVNAFCNNKPMPKYPGRYDDIDWDNPLPIRKKTLSTQEDVPRALNICGLPPGEVVEREDPCDDWLDEVAHRNAEIRYNEQIEILKREFNNAYHDKCMSATETFTLEYPSRDYHYTLYYYDQAGNLLRTVPPAGVKVVDDGDLGKIRTDRTKGTQTFYTEHILNTVYEYNSLNQLVKQSVPDHDKMNIWNVSSTSGVPSGFVATDIQFVSGNEGIMVGNINGLTYFLRSTDGGNYWSRDGNIYANDLTKVSMADNNIGYAIGKGGILIKTIDGGTNWKIVTHNNRFVKDLLDIIVKPGTGSYYKGFIAGKDGLLERFTDYSGTMYWTTISPAGLSGDVISLSFKETSSDTSTRYALVNTSGIVKLIKSTSWTGAWSVVNLADKTRAGNLTSNYFIDGTDDGYAGGEDGILLKTTNGGDDWKLIETKATFTFKQLFFPSTHTNKGVALGGDGKLYKTTDGGLNWILASSVGFYRGFHFWNKSNGNGFAVGDDGLIARIEWKQVPPTTGPYELKVIKLNPSQLLTDDFTAVSFSSADDGIVVGTLSKIYKITYGSTNLVWYPVSSAPSGVTFTSACMLSSTMGVVTANNGTDGYLYKVDITGGGPTYTGTFTGLATTSGDNFFQTVKDATNIYALHNVSTSVVVKSYTYNTGTSTVTLASTYSTSTSSADDGPILAIGKFNTSDLIVCGGKGAIYKYSSSWTNKSYQVDPGVLNKVKIVTNTTEFWLAGNDGNLFKSDDDAAHFKQVQTGTTTALTSMDFYSSANGFAAGNENKVIYINGSTLTPNFTGFTDKIQDIVCTGTGTAFFLTDCKAEQNTKKQAVLWTSNGGTTIIGRCPGSLLLAGTNVTAASKMASGDIAFVGTGGSTTIWYNWTTPAFGKSYICPGIINSMHIHNSNGMAVGNDGISLKSADFGKSWTYNGQIPITGTTFKNLNKVWVNDANSAYVVGNDIFAKKMHTDASSYVDFVFGAATSGFPTITPSTVNFRGIAFNDEGIGVLVGGSYVFKYDATISSKWIDPFGLSGVVFNDVDIKGKFSMAVGDADVIYVSDDFTGATPAFSSITSPTSGKDLKNITMYDMARAYITGESGTILKTVNRGGAWVLKDNFAPGVSPTTYDLFALALNKRDHLVFAGAGNYCKQVLDQADFTTSMFWYDKLGRMAVSQNTKQFDKSPDAYSYTLYDPLGRITEVGEKANANSIETVMLRRQIDSSLFTGWIGGTPSSRTEVTQTFYDGQFSGVSSGTITQNNMVKRVASVTYEDVYDANNNTFQHATHYSYDIHGNVDHLVQDVPALSSVSKQYTHIYYDYDLVSGKVNQVDYNPGKRDEYHHRYSYDADNRLVDVETSHDGELWDRDASYEYYLHGPLARTEIGDLKVQGLDYSYTIQGWIKGVNSNTMDETRDPGRDGDNALGGNIHAAVSRDAFGYTLGYFSGDYTSISSFTTPQKFEASTTGSDLIDYPENLWNGNIGHMVTCLPKASAYDPGGATPYTIDPEGFGNGYLYDQLNRLKSSRTFTNLDYVNNEWQSGSGVPNDYATDYTYDAMGNILTQKRNGHSSINLDLDDLTYNYQTDPYGLVSNRLYMVDDAVSSGNYSDDIDDQGTMCTTSVNNKNNYEYDALGNLVKDSIEQIATIEWTVYGKIKSVSRRSGSSKPNLEFGYDAGGNRLWKKITEAPSLGGDVKIYYYLRDAQGNEMCRYLKYLNDMGETMLVAEEHSIYGSSRVGVDNRLDTLYKNAYYNPSWYTNDIMVRNLGKKSYEMSNHLGNVLVTVTDKKVYVSSGGVSTPVDYFEAELTSITDYYPFGSVMQTRNWSSSPYRYGFNNQEKDDELSGEGNAYSFEYRIHDPRLGRFLSIDPLLSQYPWNSPYAFAENRCIDGIDLEGKEWDASTSGEGTTNVSVNISVKNNTELSQEELDKYYKAASEMFNTMLSGSSAGQYTGKITFNGNEGSTQIVPSLEIIRKEFCPEDINKLQVAAQTIGSSITANLNNKDNTLKTPEQFAFDLAHELLHTLKMEHPFEMTQGSDTKLVNVFGNDYLTTPFTDPNIYFNIMNYGSTTINGQKLGELWKKIPCNKMTSDQIDFMMNQINIQKSGVNLTFYYFVGPDWQIGVPVKKSEYVRP